MDGKLQGDPESSVDATPLTLRAFNDGEFANSEQSEREED